MPFFFSLIPICLLSKKVVEYNQYDERYADSNIWFDEHHGVIVSVMPFSERKNVTCCAISASTIETIPVCLWIQTIEVKQDK